MIISKRVSECEMCEVVDELDSGGGDKNKNKNNNSTSVHAEVAMESPDEGPEQSSTADTSLVRTRSRSLSEVTWKAVIYQEGKGKSTTETTRDDRRRKTAAIDQGKQEFCCS